MIDLIVVPLDRSDFAEQAIQPASYLAHRLRVAMELVHVVEPLDGPYAVDSPVLLRHKADLEREAMGYLQAVAEREGQGGEVAVRTTVLEGPVVEALSAHLVELEQPLAVMTTHGRSGLGRALLGSVMDALVRSTTAPVLAIRVRHQAAAAAASRFGRILVPIEGADFGAGIAERAADTFGIAGVEYHLMHAALPVPVLPPPDPVLVPPVQDLDTVTDVASDMLETLAGPLRARGAHVRTRVVIDPDPSHAILEEVKESGADAIGMATHGRRGIRRLVLGSVAGKVLRHALVPVLLFRPPEAGDSMQARTAGRAATRNVRGER